MKNVAIVPIGPAGNLTSVLRALEKAESSPFVAKSIDDLQSVSHVVLPGVGAYPSAMKWLNQNWPGLKDVLITKKVLGICLGMQLLSTFGYEYEECAGFGLLEGEVRKLPPESRTPHMGWAPIRKLKDSPLFESVPDLTEFYFMHSYEFQNYPNVTATCLHGNHSFVSAVELNNIFGVQFHPEKSLGQGIQILRNFISL